MTTPIYIAGGREWRGDHDPQSSETCVTGIIEQYDTYLNTATGQMFRNMDATVDALVWVAYALEQ